MKSFLHTIDYFSIPISLSFHGTIQFSTISGGILTILFLIIIISIIIFNFLDFMDEKNFTLVENTLTRNEEIKINSLRFMFYIMDVKKNIILRSGNKIFNFEVFSFTIDGDNIKYTTEPLKYGECKNYYRTDPYLQEHFTLEQISNMYCIDPNEQFSLKDEYINFYHNQSYIRINIMRCVPNNETECYSDSEINENLKNVKVILRYLKYSVDHYSSKISYQHQIVQKSFELSTNFLKKYYVDFTKINYNVEGNILYPSATLNISKIGNENFEFNTIGSTLSNSSTIMYIQIGKTNEILIYTKTFPSLLETLKNIGANINTIFFIINSFYAIFVKGIFKYKYVSFISNRLEKKNDPPKDDINNIFQHHINPDSIQIINLTNNNLNKNKVCKKQYVELDNSKYFLKPNNNTNSNFKNIENNKKIQENLKNRFFKSKCNFIYLIIPLCCIKFMNENGLNLMFKSIYRVISVELLFEYYNSYMNFLKDNLGIDEKKLNDNINVYKKGNCYLTEHK